MFTNQIGMFTDLNMIRNLMIKANLTVEFSAKIRSSSGFSRSNLLTSVVCNTVHKFATALVKDRQEILHIRPAFVSLICNFLMFHHQCQYKNVDCISMRGSRFVDIFIEG